MENVYAIPHIWSPEYCINYSLVNETL